MNIETKFKVGDKVFTIDPDTLRIKDFEVEYVSTVTSKDGTRVTLYPKTGGYAGYDEGKCFHSRERLIAHVTEP